MGFWAADDHDKSVELEELATVTHPESNVEYLFYTDFETDSDGRTKVYVSEILKEPDDETFRLGAVRNPADWEYLEQVLQLISEVTELEDEED